MGGLARLAGAIRDTSSKERPLLILDYGNSLADPRGIPNNALIKPSRIMIDIFKELGYDLINVGEGEVLAGRDFLEKVGSPKPISSNLYDEKSLKPVFKDFAMIVSGKIRFLITGLFPKNTPYLKDAVKRQGMKVIDPSKAIADILASQKGKFDFSIVLSSMDSHENEELAKNLPGIDIMIGSKDHTRPNGMKSGSTIFMANWPNGQSISDLDLSVKNTDRRFTDISDINEIKAMIERVDSAIAITRNSVQDIRLKRQRISGLVERREGLQRELETKERYIKDPAINILEQEQVFLDSAVPEDKRTRQILADHYRKEGLSKRKTGPGPKGQR